MEDSLGSAMQENARYMESLEAKTTTLKATFQDLANNVIDNELVGTALTLLNGALNLVNNDVGALVIRLGLLTGATTGVLTIWGTLLQNLFGVQNVFGTVIPAGAKLATVFGAIASKALPVAAAISGIVTVLYGAYKLYKEFNPTLEETTEKLDSTNSQLDANRKRLQEINNLPWNERTAEILAEKDALEKENDELEKQQKLLKEQRKTATGKEMGGEADVYRGTKYTASGITGASGSVKYFESYDAALDALIAKYGKAQVEAQGLAEKITAVDNVTKESGEFLDQSYIGIMDEVIADLQDNYDLTEESQKLYHNNIDNIREQVELYESWVAQGGKLNKSQQELVDKFNELEREYDEANSKAEIYQLGIAKTAQGVDLLIAKYPALKNGISACNQETLNLIATNEIFNNTQLDVAGKITALYNLATAAGVAGAQLSLAQAAMNGDNRAAAALMARYGTSVKDGKVTQSVNDALSNYWKSLFSGGTSTTTTTTGGGGSSSKSTIKQATDKALEEFKTLQADIKHELEMGEIDQSEYYDKLEKLVKEYKEKAIAHMKEYGLTVKQIDQNMYSYEEDIYNGRLELAKKLAEERAEAEQKAAEEAEKVWRESLEKQKSDIETAVSYVLSKIDDEIDKLNKQKESINQFYDEQIAALQKTNDELEQQIQYEQLLNNLNQAKQTRLYVFKGGQFQYVQDVEAISAAQSELDAYNREKQLQDEVNRLEALRDAAISNIDLMIADWEKYKEQWANVVEQYANEQNRLIAEQVLGISLEQENWEKRLGNAQKFADRYNAIMASLDAGYGGGDTSSEATGGGTNKKFDFSGTSGRHWTAAESSEGFFEIPAGSKTSGGQTAGSSRKFTQGVYASKGVKWSIRHADGTLNAPGGLSLVGEQGPELRVLNSGDGVIPADITRNLWDWGKFNPKSMMSTMSNVFNIDNLTLPNARDAETLVSGLKQMAYQRAYKRA